ncbi:MAG TPA: 3-deoxy-manno-octulosonate cytidylyltransferase [Candidatus Kapabacteria bacterium]|nr:3-deoxy-manno-octulosonate cytidylyltransferase [Candidatus Kapabacteria bacterium]
MSTAIIIPARYYSQRLPQKPLALINGVSLIQRVYEQCIKADVAQVFVTTDHEEILNHVRGFGGECILTSPAIPSGTDRVAAAARELPSEIDVVINVQGDEPLVPPDVIRSLALVMQQDSSVQAATPITPLRDLRELTDPNIVKVVLDNGSNGIYFSRQLIPFNRDRQKDEPATWLADYPYKKHIGLYAYRRDVLEQFAEMGESQLERIERLEQLRLLYAGIRIRCIEVEYESIAVDVPEDIARVEAILNKQAA